MPPDPHWTTILSALLVPTVAGFAALIGYRQWKTAHTKLKLDLFDRRYPIYEAARSFISSICVSGKADEVEVRKFLMATRDAKWLLSNEVVTYFTKGLYDKAVRLQGLEFELENMPRGDERIRKTTTRTELKVWFGKQYDVLDETMSPFLHIERPNFVLHKLRQAWAAIPTVPSHHEETGR